MFADFEIGEIDLTVLNIPSCTGFGVNGSWG